ncbi:dihydrofolate reductase family protein [Larkinella sp. VNQ87]|uniref:dihydrofolate reductase family protein n=1 Tax=Larkinella sp. VNQ87 TaxID=3400921 RepID=UPI003C1236F5
MRKIILDLAVTLDGFIEGPNGEIDWCIMDDDMGFDQFLASIDTIFYGRVSYDLWGNYQPDEQASPAEQHLWQAVHSKTKYVFSRHPKPGDPVTYIGSDLAERVREIKQQEGNDIWLYGGASLITTFIDLGLIDLYRLSVHPVALGAGKPLFASLKNRLNLKLNEVKTFRSGVTLLTYSPASQ